MTFLKSQERFGQFEILETKTLFAADLVASAGVVSLNPGECVTKLTDGIVNSATFKDTCPSDMVSQLTNAVIDSVYCPSIVDPDNCPQLGGQESEPISSPYVDTVLADLGEDITGRVTENYQSVEYEDYWD